MQLNPRLAKRLESYHPERLKAILMWFNADSGSLNTQSNRLRHILNDVEHLDMNTCYQLASHLDLENMVSFSILNEFGPGFEERRCFPLLARSVTQHLAQ